MARRPEGTAPWATYDAEVARRRRKREREAIEAARGVARGPRVEVEIFAGRERVTLLDRRASAPPLYGIRRLTAAQRSALVVYGAVLEELESPGGSSELGVLVSSGTPGGGGAIDRRLAMIQLRDIAWGAIGDGVALSPAHRGRPAEGEAALGPPRRAAAAAGESADLRRPITCRAMADHVCRDGDSICGVLKRHGWSAQGRARETATEALAGIGQRVADAWNGLERRIAGDASAFMDVRAIGS